MDKKLRVRPRCLDPDTDGDGIPDSRDPCLDNPNTQCEELVVRGNPNDSGFPVTCMDGTRVTSVRECSEYEAVFGYNPTGGSTRSPRCCSTSTITPTTS